MADATREIALKIAATADVTQINALNKALRETTNIALRLRQALKDPFSIGVSGMQQLAQGATAAAAGQKNVADRTREIADQAARAAANIREAYTLTKTTEGTYYGKKRITETTRETFTGAGGMSATIASRGDEVKAVTQTVNGLLAERNVRREGLQMMSAEAEERSRILQVLQAEGVMQKDLAKKTEEVYRWRRMVARAEREMGADLSSRTSPTYQGSNTFTALSRHPNAVVTPSQVLNQQTGELDKVLTLTNSLTGAQFTLNTTTGRLTGQFRQLNTAVKESGDTMQNAMAKVALWTVATGLIFGTMRAMKGMVSVFADVEAGSISLQRVGRGFGDNLESVASGSRAVTAELMKLGVQMGSRSSETREAAVNFARLGLSQSQTVEAVRTSMIAANVANIDLVQSSKLLASAMQQFGLQASDLPSMLNKLNTMENTTRTTTADMLEAISRSGAVWREAGGSMEEFNATVAVVSQATGRSGAEIGTAFKTIATRMSAMTSQKDVFEKTGISISGVDGKLRPIGDLLAQLSKKMANLTEQERLELTAQMAGARQRNILMSALDNYSQIQDQVTRQIESAGSAEKENELVMGSLEKKLAQLVASFERLAVSLGNSGVATGLKLFVDTLRKAVDGIASMGKLGALLVAGFVAYSAAVLLATLQTTAFGKSFALIVAGASKVNASLMSMLGAQAATTASNAKTTTSNVALAQSYNVVAASASRAAVASQGGFVSRMGTRGRMGSWLTSYSGVGGQGASAMGMLGKAGLYAMALEAGVGFSEKVSEFPGMDESSNRFNRMMRHADDTGNKVARTQILKERRGELTQQLAFYDQMAKDGQGQDPITKMFIDWGAKGEAKSREIRNAIKDIDGELDKVKQQKAFKELEDQAEAAANAAKALKDRIREITNLDKSGLFGGSTEMDPVKKAKKELDDIERHTKEVLGSREYANLKATDPEKAKEMQQELYDKQRDARLKAEEARLKKESELQQKGLQDKVNFNRAAARLLAPSGADATKEIREGDAELEQIQRERKALAARESSLRGQLTERAHYMAAWGTNPQNTQDADAMMKRTLGFGMEDYRKMVGELAAVTQEGRRLDDEAGSVALQNAQRRLELVVRESEERQKQYETTRREMGQMSNMDLIRTTLMSNKLKKGDYAQMSERDMLFMPDASRQFLGRYEGMFPGAPRILPDMTNMAPPEWYSRQETPKLPNADLDYLRTMFQGGQNLRVAVEMGSLGPEGDRLSAAVQAGVTQAILNVSEMWVQRAGRPAQAAKNQPQPR